jgi:hypothetical protein
MADKPIALVEIERLLQGHTDRHDEAVILRILRGVDPEELDEVVRVADLRALFRSVDDRALGPKHFVALLDLLVRERVADLSARARGAIVNALQRGRTSSQDERAIRDLVVATEGEQLSELKAVVDTTPDHRDLHQLLYRDVDDAEIREQVLAHIQEQGRALPRRGHKVVSDIDDTVYANWKDERFPKKTIYPGVRALYRALVAAPGDLVFLSARPGDRAGVVEQKSLSSMLEKGFADAVMLAGSIAKVHSNRAIADKKHENLTQYRALWPEYGAVFFGDSGQGDAMLAERMLEDPGEHGAHAFIHDVVGLGDDERARLRDRGVRVFDSWVEPAGACREAGLLPDEKLREVAEAAEADLAQVPFADEGTRSARLRELQRALEQIRDLL